MSIVKTACMATMLVWAGIPGAIAQSRRITGRVVDSNGHAIEGASVSLREAGLGALSQADGTFLLSESSALPATRKRPTAMTVAVTDRRLIVNTTNPGTFMRCEVTDPRGRIITRLSARLPRPGVQRFDLGPTFGIADGQVYLISVTVGRMNHRGKVVMGTWREISDGGKEGSAMSKRTAESDTLLVRKSGYFWEYPAVIRPVYDVGTVVLREVAAQCLHIAEGDGRTYQILYPWDGETFHVGDTAVFRICSEKALAKPLGEDLGFDISLDGGKQWGGITYERDEDGTALSWVVPDSLSMLDAGSVATAGRQARFRVSDYDDINDVTVMDGSFSILP